MDVCHPIWEEKDWWQIYLSTNFWLKPDHMNLLNAEQLRLRVWLSVWTRWINSDVVVVSSSEAVPVMDPPAEISLVMVAVVVTTTAEVVVVFHTVNHLIGVDFHSMVPRILAVIVVVPSHTSLFVLPKGNSADRVRKFDILLESVNRRIMR